jgi:hypothetical protein
MANDANLVIRINSAYLAFLRDLAAKSGLTANAYARKILCEYINEATHGKQVSR